MWVVAGVLLGLVVLTSLIGFHVGPHAHFAAGILGVLAAVWLIVNCKNGISSYEIGTMAWKGLTTRGVKVSGRRLVSPVGADGVAVGDLRPNGSVRVNGENWSAVALNGDVPAGSPVEVLRVSGVRLEVWSDEAVGPAGGHVFDAALPSEGVFVDEAPAPSDSTNEGGRS